MAGFAGYRFYSTSGGGEQSNLSNYQFSELVFTGLVNILKNSDINQDTQMKLERFVRNQFTEYLENKDKPLVSGINNEIINSKLNSYIFNISEDIVVLLNKKKKILDSKVFGEYLGKISNKDVFNLILRDIFNTIKKEDFVSTIIYTLLFIITYSNIFTEDEDIYNNCKTGSTQVLLMSGKAIFNVYIRTLINKNKEHKIKYSTFKQQILDNYLKDKNIQIDEVFLNIGSYLNDIMRTLSMVDIKVYKTAVNSSISVVSLDDSIRDLVGNNINRALVIPLDLPMIVKPKDCNEETSGGYLLNDIEYSEPLINKKIFYNLPSEIGKKNKIFFSLNKMMSTAYKINKDLLDYLVNNNEFHKLLIDTNFQHKYGNLEKRTKYQEKEYQRFLSKKLLEEYIIKIASTFSNVPEIYFPLRLDQRGRIYPRSVYFHYQGHELAKALLQFANPDYIDRNDIESIEYLKAYGASCFGNGLNKKSLKKRVEWVNNNWDNILNFENNVLVSEADDKFLFLSFCLEMRSYENFLNNENAKKFKTFIPIQLDGTCNGFQHLAMLSNETKLFETLNLNKSSSKDDPKDFYQTIVDQVNVQIEMRLNSDSLKIPENVELKESYERLLDIGINRKIVKPAIMNKPYNATNRTLVKYIKDSLEFHHSDEVTTKNSKEELVIYKRGWYNIPGANDSSKASSGFKEDNIKLINHKDIVNLVELIFEIIYVKYPKIKELNLYLNNMVTILNKLNLPVVWNLPHGLKISQNYLIQKKKKIEPFTYLKSSITLTTTIKDSIDKNKQVLAFMPNLIHSLDSSSLVLLYHSYYHTIISEKESEIPFVNFYSVHDCYGITAKYARLLINILRSVYIELYSNNKYIATFDEDIIKMILNTFNIDDKSVQQSSDDISTNRNYSFDKEKRTFIIEGKKYILPPIKNLITYQDEKAYKEGVANANYLVN